MPSEGIAGKLAQLLDSFLPQQSLRHQLAKGISFQALANLLSQAGTFLSLLIVAKLLGRVQYGRFALVQGTITTLTAFAALGLGVTATKYVSEFKSLNPARAGRVLGLSSIVSTLSAATFAVAYAFACSSMMGETYSGAMLFGAISVAFSTLNGFQLGALAGFQAFSVIARVSALTAVASPLVTALLTMQFGLAGSVLALGANALIVWLVYHVALRGECRKWKCAVTYRNVWQERRVLLSMSAPASIAGVIGSTAIWATSVILSRRSNGYAQLAIFSAANSLRLLVTFLPNVIARVQLPLLNSLRVKEDRKAFDRTFMAGIYVSGGVAVLASVILLMLRHDLLNLFGKDFVDVDGVVPVLLLSSFVEVIANNVYQVIFVHGRMWRQVATIVLWAACLLAVTFWSSNRGALDLAFAYLAAWSVSLLSYLYSAWDLHEWKHARASITDAAAETRV